MNHWTTLPLLCTKMCLLDCATFVMYKDVFTLHHHPLIGEQVITSFTRHIDFDKAVLPCLTQTLIFNRYFRTEKWVSEWLARNWLTGSWLATHPLACSDGHIALWAISQGLGYSHPSTFRWVHFSLGYRQGLGYSHPSTCLFRPAHFSLGHRQGLGQPPIHLTFQTGTFLSGP